MGYSKRIDILCSHLRAAKTFADVGCDHGYCTEYMLKKGLCERAIFSDVSRGSLAKAEKLLAPYVRKGVAVGVLGDGFYGVPKDTEQVLIAGMGGSEILSILTDKEYGFLPKRFVFQPMHDSEKLRRYILSAGGYLERDYTFEDGKFYELLVGGRCEERGQMCDEYSDAEYEFGRENLRERPAAFIKRVKKQLASIDKYLRQEGLQEESRIRLEERKRRWQGVLDGEIK